MKKIILISILFISASLLSAQNNYFVDDVEYIKDVEVQYCLDGGGRVYDVKVNREFTDYQNEEVIDALLNEVRGLSVESTEHFDNCFDENFTFINERFQSSSLKEDDFEHLEKFNRGKFAYTSPRYSDTKIVRRKKRQIERTDDGVLKFEIDWIAPNWYTLKYLKVYDAESKFLLGETIHVEIIGVIDEHTYMYRSHIEGLEVYGEIYGLIKRE